MDGSKVLIGIPVYNTVPAACFSSQVNFLLASVKRHNALVGVVNVCGVDQARNIIAENFLKTDATHLLLADSDMLLPPDLIERLLSHGKDMVSALYFGRTQAVPMFMFKGENGEYGFPAEYVEGGLLSVDAIGLGACMIRRKVIEKVREAVGDGPMFRFVYKNRVKVVGEDIFFCEKVKEAGFGIFVDTALEIKHFGGFIGKSTYASMQ